MTCFEMRERENVIQTVLRACPPFGRGFVYIQVAFAENYAVPMLLSHIDPHNVALSCAKIVWLSDMKTITKYLNIRTGQKGMSQSES